MEPFAPRTVGDPFDPDVDPLETREWVEALESAELGGHIASYASAADLFEVAFNHFFRASQDGDIVYFQPHSAPGVYARAFLEGRWQG
jgi:pyruvate dehydrogenase complex dehydrogenase (E1) component